MISTEHPDTDPPTPIPSEKHKNSTECTNCSLGTFIRDFTIFTFDTNQSLRDEH